MLYVALSREHVLQPNELDTHFFILSFAMDEGLNLCAGPTVTHEADIMKEVTLGTDGYLVDGLNASRRKLVSLPP